MLAQLHDKISMVAYGNALLSGAVNSTAINASNSFACCNRVEFLIPANGILSSRRVLTSASDWFEHLKTSGCLKFRLRNSERESEIECVFSSHSDFWLSQLQLTAKGAADGKIWSETFKRFPLQSKPSK